MMGFSTAWRGMQEKKVKCDRCQLYHSAKLAECDQCSQLTAQQLSSIKLKHKQILNRSTTGYWMALLAFLVAILLIASIL